MALTTAEEWELAEMLSSTAFINGRIGRRWGLVERATGKAIHDDGGAQLKGIMRDAWRRLVSRLQPRWLEASPELDHLQDCGFVHLTTGDARFKIYEQPTRKFSTLYRFLGRSVGTLVATPQPFAVCPEPHVTMLYCDERCNLIELKLRYYYFTLNREALAEAYRTLNAWSGAARPEMPQLIHRLVPAGTRMVQRR